MDELNLDPSAVEEFVALLECNDEATAASVASHMVHDSNNNFMAAE